MRGAGVGGEKGARPHLLFFPQYRKTGGNDPLPSLTTFEH